MSHGAWTRFLRALTPATALAVVGTLAVVVSSVWAATAWAQVSSPSPGSDGDLLHAIAAGSTNDAWAVGEQRPGLEGGLIEHWNGSSWSVEPSPDLGADGVLKAAVAISVSDAWAVGYTYEGGNRHAVVEHWDGTQWAVAQSPSPAGDVTLEGVAAVTKTDVWAVGYDGTGATSAPALIEHWDGGGWQMVASPAVAAPAYLNALAVVGPDDVWAVGAAGSQTLTEHWNGTAWSVVASPSPSVASHYLSAANVLSAVTAVSATDVWAAGTYDTTKASNAAYHTLVEHWNGNKWTLVSSADAVSGYGTVNRLDGIAALSAGDLWAVGHSQSYASPSQALIEHWNGTGWTLAPMPVVTTWSRLDSVAAVPGSAVLWSAGAEAMEVDYYGNPISSTTMILGR